MAITYVSSAMGNASQTIPTHDVGDLILAVAHRDGSDTPPTLGTNFALLNSVNGGGNGFSAIFAGVFTPVNNLTTSGWTNATTLQFYVLRGVSTSIGSISSLLRPGNDVTWQAITMAYPNTARVFGLAVSGPDQDVVGTAPTGMTNLATNNVAPFFSTYYGSLHATAAAVASWSGANNGLVGAYVTFTIELLADTETDTAAENPALFWSFP